MILSRGFGSAMIIAGTCIGAGMLAIPATVAACGFWLAVVLLFAIWGLMTLTALLLADVNLSMRDGTNFNLMAKQTLGCGGQIVTWVAYLLLLYSLTAAYTAGGSSLVGSGLGKIGIVLPNYLNSLIFVLILGAFVYSGTRSVDHANKFFMLIKFIAFFVFTLSILPFIHSEYINQSPDRIGYIWATFPILITAFGFHHIIPTLRTYVQSDRKTLRRAIIYGGLIPLFVYIIWVGATLGSIPLSGTNGFKAIIDSGDAATGIVDAYHSGFVANTAYLFEAVALTTSFLGVTLGLFDFNRDTYRLRRPTHVNKVMVFIITFLPAFLFAVLYPNGFILALGYASIFVAILLIALPALMTWVIRSENGRNHIFSRVYLGVIVMIAVMMIALEIMRQLGVLWVFY